MRKFDFSSHWLQRGWLAVLHSRTPVISVSRKDLRTPSSPQNTRFHSLSSSNTYNSAGIPPRWLAKEARARKSRLLLTRILHRSLRNHNQLHLEPRNSQILGQTQSPNENRSRSRLLPSHPRKGQSSPPVGRSQRTPATPHRSRPVPRPRPLSRSPKFPSNLCKPKRVQTWPVSETTSPPRPTRRRRPGWTSLRATVPRRPRPMARGSAPRRRTRYVFSAITRHTHLFSKLTPSRRSRPVNPML